MRTGTIIITTLVVGLLATGATAAGLIYAGTYNVAATSDHWPVTRWALDKIVHRSITAQARGIQAPSLDDETQLLAGAANFDAMCSECHTPPGGEPSAAALGMVPKPPELTHAAEHKTPAEIFWVIKHGIKASGMPAWGKTHDDDAMWAMTAFITRLPGLSAADYRQMLETAKARGIGHGHDHSDDHAHGHDHDHDASHHAHDDTAPAEPGQTHDTAPHQHDDGEHHADHDHDVTRRPVDATTHARS